MVAEARRMDEAQAKQLPGWIAGLAMRMDRGARAIGLAPTVNIEGLVGGYTGPGGKRSCASSSGQTRPSAGAGYESRGSSGRWKQHWPNAVMPTSK
jgi:hypothetical protein